MIGAEKSKTIDEMVFYSGGLGRRRRRTLVGVRKDRSAACRPWSTIGPRTASLFVLRQLRRSNTIPIKRAEPV